MNRNSSDKNIGVLSLFLPSYWKRRKYVNKIPYLGMLKCTFFGYEEHRCSCIYHFIYNVTLVTGKWNITFSSYNTLFCNQTSKYYDVISINKETRSSHKRRWHEDSNKKGPQGFIIKVATTSIFRCIWDLGNE